MYALEMREIVIFVACWKCNRLKYSHTAHKDHDLFHAFHVSVLLLVYVFNVLKQNTLAIDCVSWYLFETYVVNEGCLVSVLWFCTTFLQDCSAYAIQEVLLTYECSESKKDGLVIMFQISILVHGPFGLQNSMLTRCQRTQV